MKVNTKNGKLLYLSDQDIRNIDVPMLRIIEALEEMYYQKGQGAVEMPPKIGIHTQPNALIHAMPAYIENTGAAGMKWVGAYPDNYKFNKPQVSGLIILNDDKTGLPYCIMDCKWITAMRTGAKSGIAASIFARKDSTCAGILGCGVQGRSNLEALVTRIKLEKVFAFDIHKEISIRYADEMSKIFALQVIPVDSPEKAVRDMDIIVTAGPIIKEPNPVIEPEWLKPGACAIPVDFDSYWKRDVLEQSDIFITDDINQLFFYQQKGYFRYLPPREKTTDLGDVFYNKKPRRENDRQQIFTMNLGLALDDMATASVVYKAAIEKGIGRWL